MDTQREHERAEFLSRIGWQAAQELRVIGDASTRSYRRLSQDGKQAILMDAPCHAEAAACPPMADVAQREALGYNALARLAGPNLHAFTALAGLLRGVGLHAPEIYEEDATLGFCLMEDLGDTLYAQIISEGADEGVLYQAAIDALVHLQNAAQGRPNNTDYSLLDYDAAAMLAEVDLLIDWYWAFVKKSPPAQEAKQAWRAAWQECLHALSPPNTLVLRDYHAENILWLEGEEGLRKVGIIDFQDGLFGHGAYDVVSLLEDARRDVAPQTVARVLAHYKAEMARLNPAFCADAFDADYAVLAAQRNAKILGIFARLVNRDGKARYVNFMPRVRAHFARDLARPQLAPIRQWAALYFSELLSS